MKTLVTYFSASGVTKRVAAIYRSRLGLYGQDKQINY